MFPCSVHSFYYMFRSLKKLLNIHYMLPSASMNHGRIFFTLITVEYHLWRKLQLQGKHFTCFFLFIEYIKKIGLKNILNSIHKLTWHFKKFNMKLGGLLMELWQNPANKEFHKLIRFWLFLYSFVDFSVWWASLLSPSTERSVLSCILWGWRHPTHCLIYIYLSMNLWNNNRFIDITLNVNIKKINFKFKFKTVKKFNF